MTSTKSKTNSADKYMYLLVSEMEYSYFIAAIIAIHKYITPV
jgi:hypothetical protein